MEFGLRLGIVVGFIWMAPMQLLGQPGSSANQKQQESSQRITDAASNINRLQRFSLRYALKPGEELRWDVEHIASVETKVGEHQEKLSSRTNSTKLWRVIEVDSRGNMTLQNSVERLSLWNKTGDDEPVSYDSEKGGQPPPMFDAAVAKVGVVLATVTIDPTGNLISRNTNLSESSFGVGDITIPFPDEPIGIGHQWSVSGETSARHGDGRVKTIKSRRLYTLSAVENQVAIIDFQTEILTPIEDPKIESQIIQKKNRGKIKFDLAAGRVLAQEIDWKEQVQGFEGAESNLVYMARLSEQIRLPRVSKRNQVENDTADLIIKPHDGKPVLRKR